MHSARYAAQIIGLRSGTGTNAGRSGSRSAGTSVGIPSSNATLGSASARLRPRWCLRRSNLRRSTRLNRRSKQRASASGAVS
eukprot:4804838-Prymnesium_polylepis.1